jgi:hypothetical protein
MMGGGGSYTPAFGKGQEEIARREAEAKRELAKATAVRRNLFISFAAEDIDEVNLLRAHAKNENSEIEFIDRSVRVPFDSRRADYIRQRISERLKQSSMTVVYLTPDSATSRWVNWEVERSVELGREVVAFHKGDAPPRALPEAVRRHSIRVVPWSELQKELKPD